MTQAAAYVWTKASLAFQEVLQQFIDKGFNVLEMGSSTGHISFRLAQQGYRITLLDTRKDAIEQARENFEAAGLNAGFFLEDFFSHQLKYDFVWNSGLIQCFDDAGKMRLIRHAAELTGRFLLFYPDTNNPMKTRGINRHEIPGVGDAAEYSVENVPLLFSSVYSKVLFGRISGPAIEMPFDMLWIYGRN